MEERDYNMVGAAEQNKLASIGSRLAVAANSAENLAAALGEFLERVVGPSPEPAVGDNRPSRLPTGGHIGTIEDSLERLTEHLSTVGRLADRLPRIG